MPTGLDLGQREVAEASSGVCPSCVPRVLYPTPRAIC